MMKSPDYNSMNKLPASPSPETPENGKIIVPGEIVLSRRDLLKVGAAAILGIGAAGGIPWKEVQGKEVDPSHLRDLKNEALKANREKIRLLRDLKEGTPKEVLGAEKTAELFKKLQLLMGCIDERLSHLGLHKVGIAGLGAGMSKEEMDQLKLFFRTHPEIAKRIEEACWHEHCAARESDDEAAEAGGKQLLNHLGWPLEKLKRAGFSDTANITMSGDLHVHPGQMLVIDGTKEYACNAQALGSPAFEIAATGVPMEYVKKEVALTGKIIGGKSGMGEVLGREDPILAFISADSPDEARALNTELKPAFRDYPKEPEVIHLIRQ